MRLPAACIPRRSFSARDVGRVARVYWSHRGGGEWYSPTIQSVDAAAKVLVLFYCKTWITTCVPERGGTTMDAPISAALALLEKSDLLPFVVLISDGAVHNEREI